MVGDSRIHYRRRLSYNTTSNAIKVVKTPGGKLTVQYLKKRGKNPHCGECGIKLPGVWTTHVELDGMHTNESCAHRSPPSAPRSLPRSPSPPRQ